MALTKYCLGDLLELTTETNANNEYGASDVRGMTITKEIIPTKADVSNTDISKFLVVHPGEYVFNPRTHGKKIGFGYNDTDSSFLISWNNIAFRIKDSMRDKVLSEYLFFHFNRAEWDREACYRSWGSSTEVFTWEALCEMELDLPSITVQQKYVDVYNSMLANQRCYERGLEDLKLTIDALLERFKKGTKRIPLGELIIESDERNKDDSIQSVNGVNKDKLFMPSVANSADLTKYKLVRKNQFSCNLMHVGRDVAVSVALNLHDEPIIVSPAYIVFNVKNDSIIPEFLLMWLSRTETDRYAWFMCDTNVRSGMEKKRFFEIDIPVPSIQEQRAIIEIYDALYIRREVNERLKAQIKDLCPILVKGAVEEGKRKWNFTHKDMV
ncbi:MAG: restriction endonuclease subunit S [Ruminococcus sp.]|nr:restriction endonuclease subunit S [Ruminococcus sp.]